VAVAFHNATSAQGNPLTSQSFALPTISAGDVILLWVSWQPTGAVTISGAGTWTHQGTDSLIAGQIQVGLWTAISASGSESGQNVTINVAAQEKFSAVAMSYSGVDNSTPLQSGPTYAQNTTSNTTSATAPSVSPSPAGWVLEGYAAKSSTNASYTTPSGTTSRQQVFGSGSGACDFAVFDTNAAVSSGGGQTSTLGTATSNKVAVTVVLNPAGFTGTGSATETASIAGSGGTSGTGAVAESATIAGAGSANYTKTGSQTVTASIAGAGGGTGSSSVTVTAAIAGTGTAKGSGAVSVTSSIAGTGTAKGSGAVTVTAAIAGSPAGAFSGSGAVAVTAAATGAGAGTGSGSASVSAAIAGSGTVGLVGTGSLTVTAAIAGSAAGGAFAGSGAVSVAAGIAGQWYFYNDAEEGTAGSPVGLGNSAGSGYTADGSLQLQSLGGPGSLKLDNTQVALGSLSFKHTFDASGNDRTGGWGSSQVGSSITARMSKLVYLPSLPGATLPIGHVSSTTGAQAMAVQITSAGKLQVLGTTGSATTTSSATVPVGSWFRVEWAILVGSATVGQVEARLFTNPFGTTPTETVTSTATINTTSGALAGAHFGAFILTGPASYSYWDDEYRLSQSSSYPPAPAVPAYTGSGSRTATATIAGSGVVGYTGAGTLSTSAAITGTGTTPTANSGAVTATATITGAGSVSDPGSLVTVAAIAGVGKTTAGGAFSATVAIVGTGTVTASAYVPRTATSGSGNNKTVTATLPTGVVAGDLLLCHLSVSQGGSSFTQPTVTTPSGWALIPAGTGSSANPLINQGTSAGIVGAWYYRWATGTDPAPTWTLNTSVLFKYSWAVEAYSGGPGTGAPTGIFGSGATGTVRTTSTTGTASVFTATWYAETYSERSTTNAAYTNPAGTTRRTAVFGSGGAAADLLWVDSNGPVSGTVGGDTATDDGTGAAWQTHGLIVFPVSVTASIAVTAIIGGSGNVTGATPNQLTVTASITGTGSTFGINPGLFIQQTVKVVYTIQLLDAPHLGSGVIGDLEQASGRSLTWATPDGSQLSWTMPGNHAESLLAGNPGIPGLWEMCTDAVLWRDPGTGPVKLWRGRVSAGNDTADGDNYTIPWTAVDYKALFATRLLLDGDTLTFSASTDVAAIAWALISTCQARTNGSMGLSKSTDGWNLSGTANTGKTFGASFVVTPGTDLQSALNTLLAGDTTAPAGAAAGFDWWIDADLKVHIRSRNQTAPLPPGRGNASTFVADYGGMVQSFTRTPLVDQYANLVRGDGGTVPSTASAPTLTTDPMGRVERAITVSVDTTQATAQQNALVAQGTAEALLTGNLPASSFSLVLARGVWSPDVLGVGDNVPVVGLPGRLAHFNGVQRALSLQIDVGDDGDETVTVTIQRPDVQHWQADELVKLGQRVRGLELRQ
jgi:hypothetical protein